MPETHESGISKVPCSWGLWESICSMLLFPLLLLQQPGACKYITPIFVFTWHSPRSHDILPVSTFPSYKHTSHIGFRSVMFQYNFAFTDYICRDHLSQMVTFCVIGASDISIWIWRSGETPCKPQPCSSHSRLLIHIYSCSLSSLNKRIRFPWCKFFNHQIEMTQNLTCHVLSKPFSPKSPF